MITFVYGVSGSGKSTLAENRIKNDITEGRKVYLVVPEQQTYIAEKRYTMLLPPGAQLNFEVVNFTRLSNIARRRYGGLSYNYIDSGTKSLLMWKNLRELAPLLEEYTDSAKSPNSLAALSDMMLSAIGEMNASAITPASLELTAKKTDRGSSLYRRLRDLSLIWASYDNMIKNDYDDSSDDLAKLAEILKEHDLFSGYNVYIDSFTTYTEQEYIIIDMIMKQADNTVITVSCDGPFSKKMHFEAITHASDKLRKLAGSRGSTEDIILHGIKRSKAADFALIEKYLWDSSKEIPESERTEPENISVIRATDRYSEAEAAACCICNALRSGMRCRDIAVIMRDAGKWRGITDAVFDKFNIPYFLSEKTELTSKPLFKLLMSALNIKNRGWRQSDVISLLKTGLCGFDNRECDIFEDYCNTWNITGKRFLDDSWSMNPDGYVDRISDRAKDILAVANNVRERLVPPLLRLFNGLDTASGVREQCRAIYNYTEEMNVRAALDRLSGRESLAGDIRSSEDSLKLYNIYINSLDTLYTVMKDTQLDTNELAVALHIIFENTQIGSLPTRHDEVTIGSASLLRADNPKLVIVMGMCEGEFPANISEHGIFSFAEREKLSSLGLSIPCDSGLDTADEMFFAYRALTAPSEKLVLSYCETDFDGTRHQPSRVITRLQEIFRTLKITDHDTSSYLTRIQTPETALEYLSCLKGQPEEQPLKELLSQDSGFERNLRSLDIPVADKNCTVSRELGAKLFGPDVSLSQSRIEKYMDCPFSYYCNYVLNLRKSAPAEFDKSNAGTFIHYVMEQFMRKAYKNGKFDTDLNEKSIEELLDIIVKEYTEKIIPQSDECQGRISFLISKLRRISLVLIYSIINEFSHSLFRPVLYEYSISGSKLPLVGSSPEASNEKICLNGNVDRIDIFKKGNDIYVKIIDYKTGAVEYSPKDIQDGKGLQLLLYLFTVCSPDNKAFRDAVGCPENGKVYPAGAFYISAKLPDIKVDANISREEIYDMAASNIKCSGPLLADDDVIRAMNDSQDLNSILSSKKRKAKINILSTGELGDLYKQISDLLISVREKMRMGDASASPKIKGKESACDYCPYTSVCRSSDIKNNR